AGAGDGNHRRLGSEFLQLSFINLGLLGKLGTLSLGERLHRRELAFDLGSLPLGQCPAAGACDRYILAAAERGDACRTSKRIKQHTLADHGVEYGRSLAQAKRRTEDAR